MKTFIMMAVVALFMTPQASYAAEGWGIDGEQKVRFEGKVVDVACELSGNCPANCGNGKRQLGLLKDDGTLILAVKNADPFAGAANDLIGFCQKRIMADGLLIKNKKMTLFALQYKRLAKGGKWSRATQFTKDWSKANSGKNAGQWFRDDKRVKQLIQTNGVFGIPGLKQADD